MATLPHSTRETPISEWIAASVGACLLVGTLATLVYDTVSTTASPPDLHVEVITVATTSAGYRVDVRVRNAGTQTAAEVQVRAEVSVDGSAVETADAVIDYVAGGASATAGLLFAKDPRAGDLSVRAVGYRAP